MDQIRVALAWLKEQHFWVLTGVASLVALACWYLASSELLNQFEENEKKISQQFTSSRGLQSQPNHPNSNVNGRQQEEINLLSEEVRRVWAELYDRQRKEALKWPEQLDDDLSRSFTGYIKDKPFGEFIPNDLRDRYLNYVQEYFPVLPKIIEARELTDDRNMAGAGMLGGEFGMMGGGGFDEGPMLDAEGNLIEEQEYLVLWEDQLLVKQKLSWSSRPSELKIWVTQEDLWVYETLLRAIAATNKAADADRYSNAAVRNIYQFQVGAEAAKGLRTAQRIYRPAEEATSAEGGFGGGIGMIDDGMESGEMLGEGPMDMMGSEGSEDQLLLTGRYVDETGKPLPAPPDGSPLTFGTEFKRLPVKLTLKMDQRWLPRLVVELANAPLQIEVQEVRINPPEVSGSGGGGGLGGGRSGGFGRKKLRALDLAGKSGSTSRGNAFDTAGFGGNEEVSAFSREPQVCDVIVRGTVYIFNPPDSAALSTGDDAEFSGI